MQQDRFSQIRENSKIKLNRIDNPEVAEEQNYKVARIIIYGQEILEKKVALSYNCGRVYLPVAWIGKRIKIVRVN